MRSSRWLPTFLAVAVVLAAGTTVLGADPFPGPLPGTDIGAGLPAGYEPSDDVWHPRLKKLFLVGDGGTVTQMNPDGTNIVNWNVGGDLEGITYADPSTDTLYLGIEHPDGIRPFDLTTGIAGRAFDLTAWMTGPDNSGLEALTFVPDAGDPEGGLFWAGLQNDGKIYVFRLSIRSSATATIVTPVTTLTPAPGVTDISGLAYNPTNGLVYAIFDTANLLLAMRTDGTVIGRWDLPGNDQEGIAIRGCTMFIAEDTAGVGHEVWSYPKAVVPNCVSPVTDLKRLDRH